jgi:hypothetical protein
MRINPLKTWLGALVILHFIVAMVHGLAHNGAEVPLGPVANAFVIIVILIGPLAGLALTRFRPRGGTAVVTASMAGALLFGVVNHFLLEGADNVVEVAAGWRMLFGSTAALLAVIEAGGTTAGITAFRRFARR